MLRGDAQRQASARGNIRDLFGSAGLVDAAAIAASFNAVVKIADASGIPIEDWKAAATADLREALGLEQLNNNAASG